LRTARLRRTFLAFAASVQHSRTGIRQHGRMHKYRKIAQECYELALAVEDQNDRRALLDLASKWLEVAGDDPKTLKLIAQVERLKGPPN
jgi:hypothetical protein